MQKHIQRSEFLIFNALNDLEKKDKELFESACNACDKAYAPYSKFHVGASTRVNGKIYFGNNQENAAYPSGMCAERALIYWLGANFPDTPISTIAIAAKHKDQTEDLAVTPCGACRQALSEYEQRQKSPIKLIFRGTKNKIWMAPSISTLLPLAFSEENLH